ncbi:unnamed protein product [Trichogramma brassicae]|uniref:Uncharacterized protein n=1 Tax=Trichogramma brassicae TaxID=86971 RepID=A0A6H5IZS5_9HYME|nr:unnamed protein product [Trichogramma brassicae]
MCAREQMQRISTRERSSSSSSSGRSRERVSLCVLSSLLCALGAPGWLVPMKSSLASSYIDESLAGRADELRDATGGLRTAIYVYSTTVLSRLTQDLCCFVFKIYYVSNIVYGGAAAHHLCDDPGHRRPNEIIFGASSGPQWCDIARIHDVLLHSHNIYDKRTRRPCISSSYSDTTARGLPDEVDRLLRCAAWPLVRSTDCMTPSYKSAVREARGEPIVYTSSLLLLIIVMIIINIYKKEIIVRSAFKGSSLARVTVDVSRPTCCALRYVARTHTHTHTYLREIHNI